MLPPFNVTDDCITDGDIVESQRHDCRNRGRCLDTAIERRQVAFSCVQEDGRPCHAYKAMTREELMADVEPLQRLVGDVLRPMRRSKLQLH